MIRHNLAEIGNRQTSQSSRTMSGVAARSITSPSRVSADNERWSSASRARTSSGRRGEWPKLLSSDFGDRKSRSRLRH